MNFYISNAYDFFKKGFMIQTFTDARIYIAIIKKMDNSILCQVFFFLYEQITLNTDWSMVIGAVNQEENNKSDKY